MSRAFIYHCAIVALASAAPSALAKGAGGPAAPSVTASEWSQPLVMHPAASAGADIGEVIGSPELGVLIRQARASSPAIKIADARVDAAASELRAVGGFLQAQLSVSASRSTGAASADTGSFVQAVFDLDLNGRRKALTRAAGSDLVAAQCDQAAAALTLEAAIARAFVLRAALSERLAIARQSAQRSAELERIIQIRVREGEATRLELGLQSLQQREFANQVVNLETALDKTRTLLARLVGVEAPGFQLEPARLDSLAVPAFKLDAPNVVIPRRPDVCAAEARIAAAGGRVAAARAALIPTLAIGAGASLDGPGSLISATAAPLLAPIFNRREIRGRIRQTEAMQRETLESYRNLVLGALADIEDAISLTNLAARQYAISSQSVGEARQTAAIARKQYLEGDADLQRVVDVEQRLADMEAAAITARQAQLEAALAIYVSSLPK